MSTRVSTTGALPNFRESFTSRFSSEHGVLVEFDFCQLEICALAELSRDRVLIEELNTGKDIHRLNAAAWLKCTPDEVTDSARKKAKIMTFQLQYGAGPAKMASTLDISKKEASEFIDTYYNKYKGIREWHAQLVAYKLLKEESTNKQADPSKEVLTHMCCITQRGYVFSPKQVDDRPGKWYYAGTEVKNYPVQGFATADIVPIVLNLILEKLSESLHFYGLDSLIVPINTVHDSFMFDVHQSKILDLFKIVEESFTEFPTKFKELFDYDLLVKYNYDVKFGADWSNTMTKLTRKEVQLILEDN